MTENAFLICASFFPDESADPLLDEHFRRSLGAANYQNLFNKDKSESSSSHLEHRDTREKTPPSSPSNSNLNSSSGKLSSLSSPPLSVGKESPPRAMDIDIHPDDPEVKIEADESNDGHAAPPQDENKDPVRAFHEDMEGYTGENGIQTFQSGTCS